MSDLSDQLIMLDLRGNFKTGKVERKCRMCEIAKESQQHNPGLPSSEGQQSGGRQAQLSRPVRSRAIHHIQHNYVGVIHDLNKPWKHII